MKRLTAIFLFISLFAQAQLPIIIRETFDQNTYGWFESETPQHKVLFRDGKYYMEAPKDGWMSYVAPYLDTKKDFSIEALFTQLEGENDNGIGFIWGHDGKDRMNSFTFTTNG